MLSVSSQKSPEVGQHADCTYCAQCCVFSYNYNMTQ